MEVVPAQHSYLFDEHQSIGKNGARAHGPNAVISMLRHHLDHHSKGALSLCLHADNCSGQNKKSFCLTLYLFLDSSWPQQKHRVVFYACWPHQVFCRWRIRAH